MQYEGPVWCASWAFGHVASTLMWKERLLLSDYATDHEAAVWQDRTASSSAEAGQTYSSQQAVQLSPTFCAAGVLAMPGLLVAELAVQQTAVPELMTD